MTSLVDFQVDHLEDELKDPDLFRKCQDEAIAECPQELATFFHGLITRCLSRHSKRPTSVEVYNITS